MQYALHVAVYFSACAMPYMFMSVSVPCLIFFFMFILEPVCFSTCLFLIQCLYHALHVHAYFSVCAMSYMFMFISVSVRRLTCLCLFQCLCHALYIHIYFSACAMPYMFEACAKLNIDRKLYTFGLPTALTFNADGSAAYICVACQFMAIINGISLDVSQLVIIW